MSHEVLQAQRHPAQIAEGLQAALPNRRIQGAGTLSDVYKLYVLQGRRLGKVLKSHAGVYDRIIEFYATIVPSVRNLLYGLCAVVCLYGKDLRLSAGDCDFELCHD